MVIRLLVVVLSLAALGANAEPAAKDASPKTDAARATGVWRVAANQFVYQICRAFSLTDLKVIARCAREIHALNPLAFDKADPSKLRPGALLTLPAWVLQDGASAKPPTVIEAPRQPQSAQASPIEPQPAPAAPNLPTLQPKTPAIAPVKPAAYRDKLIGGVELPDEGGAGASRNGKESRLGQRSFAIGSTLDLRDESARGVTKEFGTLMQYRHETENWGEWAVDLAATASRPGAGERSTVRRSGQRVTLMNNLFPVTERLVANSSLGVIRTPLNTAVTNSFRFTLSSPIYSGVTTSIGDGRREFRFAAGEIGTLGGLNGGAFERTSGNFVSLGGNLRIGEEWSVGAQAINVRGVAEKTDHSSVVSVLRRGIPGVGSGFAVHTLLDDKGQYGAWIDGDLAVDRTRHRWGAYRLEPGLRWADTPIANDQQGVYWRADRRGLRQFWTGGISFSETNLVRTEGLGGQRSADAFLGTTMRLDRSLSVGGNLALQTSRPHSVTATRSNVISGSAFGSRSGTLGTTRLDAARYLLRPGSASQDVIDNFSLSHDWSAIGGFTIASAISASRERNAENTSRRESASLSVRSPIVGDVQWDLGATLARVTQRSGTEQNFNFSLSAIWSITNDLTASAQINWSTIDPLPPLPGATGVPFRREKRAQLTLRYDHASGAPYATRRLGGERLFGTGRIVGQVFFDENGDGVRQANERGAPNLTVYLDGRYPATTDANGRFAFSSVAVGPHTLLIQADSLPLPWSIDSERGVQIVVPLRSELNQDIPLVRIRP